MKNQSVIGTNRKYLPALNGLRGIACLYVIITHLRNGNLYLFPLPYTKIAGMVGVWIFFVLSAYLLTTNLYSYLEVTSSKFFSILKYAIYRIFRIYFLYLFVLIIHAFLGDISIAGIFGHILLRKGWHELWTIPVEYKSYIMIPVIAISTLRLSGKYVIFLFLIALTAAVFFSMSYPDDVFCDDLHILPKLTPFLFGSLLSLMISKKLIPSLESKSRSAFIVSIISLVVLFISTIFFRQMVIGSYAPWTSIVISMSVAGIIYSAVQMPAFGKLIGIKPLAFLGEISFSMYLLHIFLINLVMNLFDLSATVQAWVSLGLIILCSYVTYSIIEQPGIRMGRKVAQHLQKRYFS